MKAKRTYLQEVEEMMNEEFGQNQASNKYHNLSTLYIMLQEAGNKNNENIYSYNNGKGTTSIIIKDITSLFNYGTDFTKTNIQARLRGLAENFKNEDGSYLVSVTTTHDLNYAIIRDVAKLIYLID